MLLQLLRKYTQYSDEELVMKFQASKDSYYAGLLFERYNEMTVSLALNYLKNESDAEDAVMECFELLYKDLKTAEVKNFGGWYYSVVRNHLLKLKRSRRRNQGDELIEGFHDQEHGEGLFDQLFNHREEEINELVKEVLESLKPIQSQCVEAFYLNDKSYKEISMELAISEKEVKSHLQNGKRKFKIELEKRNVKSVNEIS
ncbi:RNA polymerase sigma factor [Brumimicrobium sp.]|uniref:RNA polymerase sigma factor n=1 Tax=Brumimicrobium sp. TaxID=2029867 RepID=UPI0026245E3A|nr:RNA polymerase sigma factor [uncultured Brumimicrobium sp.]